MPQPQEGQPKGKVDVFGVLHDAATKDQQFDPYRYAHRLGSDSRKGLYDLHLDEAAVREKYKTDPAYAGPEGQKKLTDDLAAARGFLTLTQSDQYDSGYRAMPDVLSGSQIRPWVTGYRPVRDPYTTYDGRGNNRPTGGSRQKVAENLGVFYDRHGQLTPLTSKDIKERALEVTSEMATNAEGDVLERPVLRELRYGQSAYNKEMFSSWGGKAMSRTWLGAFMTDLAASVSGIQAGFGALAEQAAGMNSRFRASALMRAYDELGGPGKAATVNRMMERGVLYPEYANSTFIPSIDAPLTMARTLAGFVSGSAGSVTANQDEEFYKKITAFKKDEANIRKQAAQGNPQAKIAADLLDIYDGMQGKSVIERIADTSYMLKGHMTPATSMRRDEQGMLGGAEAISGTLGSLAGFMIPGAALGRGVATGLLKYGGEALIARSVARGMQATLTKAGAQVAGFGGATAPALQMAQIGYYGARDAGYKHGQALKVATAMAPMAFMSEFLIGSPWLIKSMIGGGKGELTAAVAKALGKPAEIEKLSWNQQAFRGMIGMWQGLKKGSDNAALNTGANALEAALREFSQEFTEEGTYALIEEIQDQASGEYKYRNSRPKDYSLTNRLFENGAAGFLAGSMMGSLAGGRRQVQPYDERIAALVANGEANNVRKIAQKMREDGQITDETMQVLEQNIALSEDIMQGMNVSDPQVLEHLMEHQDLSGEYAQRSMEVKGAQARIAELDAKMQEGGSDNDALGREKKEIEEQITEHQARIGQILDGTEVVRRLKNSLMALKGAKVSADGVDRTASAFRSYADKKRADLETIRVTRGEGIEAINAELDALVNSKPGDTTEAVMTVQSGQANLQKTGSLLQEDVQRTLEILSLKKQEVMAEMMKVKPPSSESETDFQSMQQLVDELMQEGDGTTRDFLQEYEKQLYRAKPNEPVVQLYEEYKSLEAAERAYGADENNRTRFKQGLLTQKTLDQGYTQEELLEKFMMNLGIEQGNDVRDLLADARQQQETTDEQQKYLAQVIKALEGLLAVHEEMTTSMSEVAQRLPGSKVAKLMGQDLPAIQQLQQDDKQVYEAARNMNPESIALMRDTLAALRTEQERLDQQLSHRSAQLAKIHWVHQVLSAKMITMYGAFDPAMGKNKAYVDTMTLLEAELTKSIESRGSTDKAPVLSEQTDVLIARLKDIISEQLVGNTSDAKRFLKHALDKFDWGNEKTNNALRYQETGRLNQTDMSEWFVETLFDDPNMGNTHLASGAVAVLTNFVSEVSRARTASLYQAYSEYTASVKALPNYEQERAALEVVSFLSSPDQELTRALIGAKRLIDADQAAYAKSVEIPNSITVPGPPGVGKTKFIVPPVVSMFGKVKRRPLHVVVVTPGRNNRKEIHSELAGLQEEHRIVTIGFHEVASVAAMENVDLIIVDEAHAADNIDALAFKQMMESQPDARGLFLGDPMQAPSIANKDMVFPVERRMMRALPLQVTFRQTNIPIISTINELHAQVYKNRLGTIMEPRLPSTQYIERTNQGVRFITSSDRQVVSSFAEHMLRSVGDDQVSSNVMLITLNENDRQNALAILAQDPALLHSFPMDQLERRVLTMDKGAHSALGLEADIAFVAIKPQDLGSSYTRFLYTAISRGREGAVAFMPTGRSSPADSLPRINTKISSLNEMWTETAARVKSISDDLIPRLPKEGVKPVEPKKPTVNEEEQGEELTGDEVPPDLDEQAQAAKTTRYSTQYDKAPGFMPGSTITLAFNPDFPKGNASPINRAGVIDPESALTMKNPAYKLRMALIQQVFTNPGSFPVKVIKRKGAQYNSPTGIYNAPGVSAEIHLTEDSETVINTLRQQTIEDAKPVEYADLFATGATMLGTLYINTQADGSQLDQAQSQLLTALEDANWVAGKSRTGYENLSLGKLYAGQRHAPFGRETPEKFSTFLSMMEAFGFHVSDPYMVPAKTKEESWVGKDGVVRPQAMVDVSPYPGGPLTKVFISGGDLDEAYYTRMYEGIANAVTTGTTADVLAFTFLQWNRARLIQDGQFADPSLTRDLIIDAKGYPDVIVKRSEDLAAWGKHLRSAIETIRANERLSAEVTKALRINKNARNPNNYDTIQIEDQEHAVASVARVNMPAFTVNLSRVVKTTPKASGRVTGVSRTKLKTAYTSGKLRRESIVKTENYFRKVFGNRFVDGQLEFKPRLTTRDGRALWGVMENGRIALEAMDGTVRAHVGRHEAAHRVVEYLLDEESYRRVMDEAEMRVAKARGVKSWQVNPDDVHEFISEQYEKPTYHTDTLFGRFMRWLKGVMKRWNLYRSAIDDLLYAIEDGAFKDAPERSREEVTRYSEKIPDEQALQGSYAISNVEPVSNPERITFRNRNFLNELFIDSVTAQGIVDLVAQRLLRASQYQVPADKDLTLPLPSLKDAYHEVLGAIKLASKEVDPTGLDGLNKQQLLELDDDRWDDYKTVKLADNSIFNTVFQSVFPGIDMEQMLLDGKLYSENEEVDIDEDMLDRMSAHIHNSNENTDPFERQSALTQLHLQTVRMITTPEEGGVAIENENEAGVDLQMLQAVMVDAAYMSIYSGKGVSSMEIMKERLLDINKKFPGTKRAAHAMTMYHRYLDPSGYYLNPEGQKTYSYRYLLENADSLMLKAKTPVAAQNLQGRIDQARTALTNVVRSFRELAGVTYKITEFSPGEFEQNNDGDWTAQQGRMNHRTFGFGSGNEIKNEINRQLDLGFVASGSDAVVVDPDYRKQWIIGSETDEQQGFTINEQGVFMPDGTPLVETLSKGFLLKNRDAEMINGFFSAAGYVPHTKTIELLLAEESGDKLARIIGFWSMAIHASLHQVESGRVNSELFSRKKLEESKSAGVGTRTSADLHSSRDLEGKQYPLPSTLIGINESLSEIETASQGRSHLPRLMSVKGKPIHSINFGSLKTMLLPGSDGVTYSSKALEEYAETLVKRDPALRRADGTWLIPHLDPKDPCRISNVFLGSGIKDTSRGIGKDVLHMTELDIASEQVDFFAQQLLSGGRSERIVLGMHPDGDRNNITYTRLDDPFGTDKRVLAVDGKSVKFIPSVLQGWVMKAFAYHYEQHKASKARWTKHAGSDLKTIMADPEMMRFRDYVVKGDKALPGNATEFNTSGIYNKQNYERILAASKDGTLDSVIADIYKPYHEAFVTKLFDKKATETEPAVEGIGYRWQPSIVKKTTPDSRQAMIEGLFYMTHLNDVFLSAAMQGSQFNYKNAQDFIKRSVGLQAPGSSPMPIAGGLGEELRVAIIAEPVEGKKVLDGQDYILPFMLEELKASFGGNEGVFRPTANKMVTFQNDLYIKSSQLPITHEIYQKNPWLADQVKRSLVAHPELLQTWNNAVGQSTPQQFAAAVKAVRQTAKGQVNEKGEVLKEEIPLTTFISSESNVKMGLRGVNFDNSAEEESAWEESSFDEDEARANAEADYDARYPYEGYISEGDEVEPDLDYGEAERADRSRYEKEKKDHVDRRVLDEKESAPKLKRKPLDFQRMDQDPTGDLRGRTLNRFRFKNGDKNGAGPFGTVFKEKSLSFLSLDDSRWSSSSANTGGVKLKPEQFTVSQNAKIAKLTNAEEYKSLLSSLGSNRYPTDMDELVKAYSQYDAIQYVPVEEVEVDPDGRARVDKLTRSLGGAQLIVMNQGIINKEASFGTEKSGISPFTTLGIDTRSLRLQTNLERSLKSLRAPFFNQYAGLMGVSPEATALVNELNRYTADLADKYLSDANEAIEKMPYVDRQDKVTAWIKQLGIRKTAQQGAIGQVVDMLSDPDSSINNPLLRRKVMQIVANELTVDAINPKMNGQMFTQVSGHGFLHIPIPETPAIIPHPNDTSGSKQLGQSNDAVPGASEGGEGGGLREGSGEQPGVDAGTTSPDQLEPLAIAQDGAQAGAGLGNTPQPIALRPPRNEGGKYMRGEVMMPFLYAKEFGFEGEAWRDMSFKEVRADIYSRLKEEGVKAFDRAMNVFTVRGPSSGLGSGHLMKVVDFINYSGNVVIFPPEANEYTGGDNDGDQLTVYLRKLRGRKDAEGKVVHTSEEVSPNTVEGIQSRILDVVEAFYMGNEENGWKPVDPDLILQPVGTAELEETFEKELDANPGRYAQDKANTELFTPVHSIEARRMAADGVNLIGVMMQYMKGYSYLSQALNNADPGDGTFMDWTPQFKGDNDSYVSSNISQLGNGALDNTKLNIIGRIGINMHNVGLVMGAVMDGYGLADVIALAKDPMVLSMVRKLEKQDSLNLGDEVRNRTTMLDMLIEESGNPPLEVEGQQKGIEPAQLVHWAAVGEAVSRMAKIYSMGTDGIPIDDHGLDSLNHHIEATTSARMSDLIDGSLPTPDYYQLIEPKQRNRFIYQSREELVRSLFDPRRALQLQPNTMSQIRTLDWTNKLYADSLLERHPVLINAFKQFTYDVGRNEVLSENGRKVYNQQYTGMMISLYMDQQYGKLGSELITTSTGRSYGLGDKGGMDQYVRDFPDMWKNAVDQILRLPQTHPAREAYMNNKFLQEAEVSGKSSFKVQMRDGRRITNDPRLNEQVRRDASRIDAVFGHPDLGGFQGMQKRLSIYSQLKDRFSFDRNSFAPFLASTEDAGLGNLYDGMLTALQKVGKEIKLYPLSSGVTISVEEFIKEFVESLAATEGQLAPVWSKKESPTFTTYYATKKRVGFNSFFEVHSRMLKDSGSEALFAIRSYIEGRLEKDKSYYDSPEYHQDKAREIRMRSAPVLSNPSSRLAPQIHPAGGNVIMNANVFRNMDRVTYKKVMSGQPKVIVTLEQGQDWDMSKPLLLPTGHAVRILSMDPTTNTAVIDASSIGTPQVSNNEDAPPGINKMATVEGGVITGQGANYHGAFNGMLNELSFTNGLKRVSMVSIAPHYRELAKFFVEQQAIVERSGQIFTMDHANKHWMGSIEDDGRINLSRTMSGLDADATLLHEAVHRFVSWTQNAPIDQLDARGLAFRRGMEDLYMEARAKLPNSKLYGFKNVQEFVAEGMTNPEFQNELRKIDGGPKQQSLWRRFVAWVNKLIGIQTDQTVLERLMDQTYGYIRYTSEQGQSFNEQVGRGELYGMNKIADAASHGVHPNRPPIVDIRDMAPHLMSSSKSEVSFDSLERDELVNYIFNNQIDRKTNFQVVDGVRFNIAGMDDSTLREYLYETVVPQLRKQFGYRKDDLAYAFNHKDFQAGWKAVFKDMRGEVLDSDVLRDQVAEQIGHQEGDVYLRYSWLKDTEKIIERVDQPSIKVGELGLQHIEAFEGYDPIIQVRQSSKGKPVITLVDVVNTYLNDRKDPNVGPKLLSNYASFKFLQSAQGMVTPNTEGGMRQFLLALTAMAMEQSMPGLKINRMKVLGVKGGTLQDQSPWMYDVLKEVEILKKTPLYRIMPDKIKAVLDDKRLFDAKLYNQDYSEHYMNVLRKAQLAGKEGLGDELSVLHLSTAEERAVTGQAGAFTDRLRMKALTHRMNELIRLRKDTVEQDPEYKRVSKAIVELKERATKGMNSNRDTSKIGANIKNMMDVQSDLQQVAIRANEMATAKISGIMNPWHKNVEGWISELDKVVWSTGQSAGAAVVDLGWKRYERIFRMSAATEADVALGMDAVYANTDDMRILAPSRTNSVHWNERDPYTAHLLKTNQITRTEVEFGNKVATEVQSLLVDSLVHKWEFDGVEHRSRTTGLFDEVKARHAAIEFVERSYPKGHIPVMTAPFSEQVSQGKVTSALKALWNANTNVDNLFDEDLEPGEKVPSYKVANRYLGELTRQQSGSPLGSSIRLSRMGLMVRGIDGATVLDDPKLNEQSTRNLEVMLAKLKLAVTRQIVHETETIPVANSVRSVMAMMEIEASKGQVYNREMLNDLLDRVRGGSAGGEKGGVSIAGVSMMPAVNLLMTYTSLAGVAVSWKVGLASALYSSIGSIGTAISSDVANDGLAGTKEYAQAAKAIVTKEGYRKMGALMDFYGVWDNQENDMAGSYLKTKSRKLIFSGHGLNILNWYPDHKMRGLTMIAQMIKDGNWEAHSLDKDGNVTYDQTKDRRFYKADGTVTEDGRILMNGLKERLVDEGARGQTMDKPLKAAYDSRSQGILKWVSDKYIQGGMDRSQQGYMNNVWYGRMFTTFRKFLETRIGHWYLRPTNVEKGGQWVVGTDPNTGEKAEMWEKREVTSYLYALISTATKAKEVMQMGWGEVEGLSKAERRSLSRLAVDLTFFALLFMLFKALDPDEEERKEMRRKGIKRSSAEIRLTTMFQDMAWDQFAGNPWSIADTFSGYHGNPIPALGTASTLLDMTTDITKIKDLLPGKTTARDLYDLYERSNTPE